MGQYTPGYVEVPGKGKRYRDEDGNYYRNHLGKPLTQIGNLFGNPGFAPTTNQHLLNEDGSIGVASQNQTKPKPKKGLSNLGPNYKNDEIAATIVAASQNPLAAGASPEARKVFGIDDRAYNGNDAGSGGGGNGRSTPAPNGSGAKGTNTGYKIDLSIAEESLGRKIADINSFLSEDLPVVGYRDQSGREIRPTGEDLSELQGSYADGLISRDNLIFEGVSTPTKKGVSAADSADNKRAVRMPGDMDDMDPMFEATGGADDDDFGGPDPEDYATNYSARRKAQRDAFLNPNITNSIDAINASNSAIGVAVRGGKYYANDGGTLREIQKDAYDKQRSTGLTSEELKGSFVDKIKATLVPVTQSNVFSDDTDLGPISEGVTYTSPVSMGTIAQTEFDMNNVAPGFSASDRAGMKANYFSDVDYDIDDDED